MFQNCELDAPTLTDLDGVVTATFEFFSNTTGKIKIVVDGGTVLAGGDVFSIEHSKYVSNISMIYSTVDFDVVLTNSYNGMFNKFTFKTSADILSGTTFYVAYKLLNLYPEYGGFSEFSDCRRKICR